MYITKYSAILRIQFWKDVGNYSEVVHELVRSKQLDETYRLMLAHGIDKEGMAMAKEHDDIVKEAEFFLHQAIDSDFNEEVFCDELKKYSVCLSKCFYQSTCFFSRRKGIQCFVCL